MGAFASADALWMIGCLCPWASQPTAVEAVLRGTGESFLSTRNFFPNGDLNLAGLACKDLGAKSYGAEEDT